MSRNQAGRKLNRTSSVRKALLRSMALSLLQKITTTEPKAKELRRFIDRLITRAKNDSLTSRRAIARDIRDPEILKKLFSEIAPRYKERNGGFTRFIKIKYRRGDAALVGLLQLV